jgi:RNA recognition motif-containing protein
MSIRLYVGNLPKTDVEREDLQAVFAEAGELVSVKVIKDRKTGKCRGFGFVTVETEEQADRMIEQYNGAMFQEVAIAIEKALPKAKGQEDDDSDSNDSSEPKEPKEPSTVPKPNLSNKGTPTPAAAGTPRRTAGGGKKGGRKEANKGSAGTTTTTTASTESFQPDPRWAGKLAELKEKLAQSGNS